MIKNLGNIDIAKHVLISFHENIIKEAKKVPELDLKKIKSDKKRQFKKNLKKYLSE